MQGNNGVLSSRQGDYRRIINKTSLTLVHAAYKPLNTQDSKLLAHYVRNLISSLQRYSSTWRFESSSMDISVLVLVVKIRRD